VQIENLDKSNSNVLLRECEIAKLIVDVIFVLLNALAIEVEASPLQIKEEAQVTS
jgi:hypothetical protein